VMKRGGFDAEGNQDDGSTMMDAVAAATVVVVMVVVMTALGTGKTLSALPPSVFVNSELFRTGRYG
jgi:hypothetical protein